MFKRIDHVELVTADLDRTIDFYVNVLGFKVRERRRAMVPPIEELAYLALGDTVVEIISGKDPAPAGDPWRIGYRMIALEVDDMDAALSYLRGKGVAPSWGPVTLGASKRAEVLDPNGLSIELRQW